MESGYGFAALLLALGESSLLSNSRRIYGQIIEALSKLFGRILYF